MTDSIKTKLDNVLNAQLTFPESSRLKQRGIADKIEDTCNEIIKANFNNVADATSNRSIEDISINGVYVDHKSSDVSKKFKMPNMISIDRLKKLDRPLIYNFIVYDSEQKTIVKTFAVDVYELNWDHLNIQNIGKGQLQINNMAKFLSSPTSTVTKEQWLAKLKESAITFYQKVQDDAAKRQKEWEKW